MKMLRLIAILFGILFIFGGIAGFLPQFIWNDLLFGYLKVNSLHNIIHMIAGVLAIMAATRYSYVKFYFKIFGILYTVIAIVGFWRGGDLYIMQVNLADNILHLIVGVIFLYLGFSAAKKEA